MESIYTGAVRMAVFTATAEAGVISSRILLRILR